MASPRPRGQRPCDNCRRRKSRCLFACDSASNCVLCQSRSTTCTYVEEPPRKKRAIAIDRNGNISNNKGAPGSSRSKVKHDSQSNSVVGVTDYSQLAGPSLLKETLGHQNRQSSMVLGATADFDQSLTHSLSWNAKGEFASFRPPQSLRRPNPTTHFLMRPDMQEELDGELLNLDTIEDFVSPHGPELVKIYFRIVHPSFPILHKNVFLEKHGRSYRELTPIGLGAVYILAMNWWSYSPALSNLHKPDCKELESKVIAMLFEAHRRPKISDLQGGLVLMQSPNVASWQLTGLLVAMAQNLGINADCSDWQIPDWERGVRKRVGWALFMQDKWGALVFGRASHIRSDDWDVQALDHTDFPETAKDDDKEEGSADIEKGKKTFMEMVTLSEIVAEILDTFFTLKTLRGQRSIHEVLDLAKPIQLKLKSWYGYMPSALAVDNTVPRKLSSVGYLHLAYYTAEITLHRAILRTHLALDFQPRPASEIHLLDITRQAADARFRSAVEFVKRLKAEHFQSFWYFSSGKCFAIVGVFAGILCTIQHGISLDPKSDGKPENDYINQLAEYRWVLRVSATGADFMKYAVGILDIDSQVLEEQCCQKISEPIGRAEYPVARVLQNYTTLPEQSGNELESNHGDLSPANLDMLASTQFDDFPDKPNLNMVTFDFWNVDGFQ